MSKEIKNDVRVATNVSAEDRQKLDEYCAKNDMSISQLLRRMIREFFEENK